MRELLELREPDTAKLILDRTQPMMYLKETDGERYYRLYREMNQWLESDATGGPSAGELYGQQYTKEQRRMMLAHSLRADLKVVEPSRLLHLVGMALRQQRAEGTLPPGMRYDPFHSSDDTSRMLMGQGHADAEDRFVTQCVRTIKFGRSGFIESACFSPNGQWLAVGSHDGFVELYDYERGALDTTLTYQAQDKIMMHEESVMAVCFSNDSTILASGSSDGMIKVWHVQNGVCLRKISKAHNKGVSCLMLSNDGEQIISGSIDGTVRIHGLQSGSCLKEFHGHQSFVYSVLYSKDGSKVISGSSDGSVRVWDARTMECLEQFSPSLSKVEATSSSVAQLAHQQAASSRSIHSVQLFAKSSGTDDLLICNDSPTIYVTTIGGSPLKHFTLTAMKSEFECCTISPRSRYIYAVANDMNMYCFAVEGEQLVHMNNKIHKRDCRGIVHHPTRNIVATFSSDGRLKIWCP